MNKALLVTVDFPPADTGGIQRYYHDLCRSAAGRVHAIAPAAANSAEFDRQQNFIIRRARIPVSGSKICRLWATLVLGIYALRQMRVCRYGKIIIGHWFLTLSLLPVATVARVAACVVLHGGELAPYKRHPSVVRLFVWLINHCDQVVANSEYTRTEYAKLGVGPRKMQVVTPAVDPTRLPFFPPQQLQGLRGFDGASFKLLTVGTLVERKNHRAVLNSLARLAAKARAIRYAVVGDGPTRRQLEERVCQLGLEGCVTFLGRLDDVEVYRYLAACDALVLPSKRVEGKFGVEGFGIVFLEANAYRKPVIGGRSGGVGEAIEDHKSGILVDPESAHELEAAIAKLYDSPALREEMGRYGSERVACQFRWAERVEILVG